MESESDPLTRRPVDLFEKEPLKGKWEVHLHKPTKFGEDPSKDLGGDREQTHTNKRCSNYSMMLFQIDWTALPCSQLNGPPVFSVELNWAFGLKTKKSRL